MTFSDEQAMLLDTATAFFKDKSPAARVRELIAAETGFDDAAWREMVGLGWSGIAIPEALGGSGLGLAAAVPIAEPMGRHLAASPWLSTQLFIQGVLAGAAESRQNEVLGAVVEGAVGTVALFEADGSWDLERMSAGISVSGAEATLHGVKTLVLDAAAAEHLLIAASLEGEPALALVAASSLDRAAIGRETVIDETRRSYRLALDGITVPATDLIRGGAARRALRAIRQAALLLIAADAAGGIAGVLELLVDYLNTRTAFGRKIGSYQGLKHPTVDILIGLERTRSHVYHSASLLIAGDDPDVALRMAKAEASDSYAFAGDRAIQFHGGFGFTFDCDAQLYLRRALWCQYSFGDAAHHRRILAGDLLD